MIRVLSLGFGNYRHYTVGNNDLILRREVSRYCMESQMDKKNGREAEAGIVIWE